MVRQYERPQYIVPGTDSANATKPSAQIFSLFYKAGKRRGGRKNKKEE
jgi:hypothetical protein